MIKLYAICILLCIYSGKLLCQDKYSEIDSLTRALKIKSNNLRTIHRRLTEFPASDELRVRSFYIWITQNIVYDVDLLNDRYARHKLSEKPLKSRLKKTLTKRAAICGGYAELFRELCRLSGIHAEVEMGFAKNESKYIGKRFKADHVWNKVKIGDKWKLIDVTWGSGGVSGRRFYPHYNDEFFFTDPNKFYYNHYPLNQNLPLKTIGFSKNEFFMFPLVDTGFFNWIKSLDDLSKVGKKKIRVGETVEISFIRDGPIGIVRVYNGNEIMDNVKVTRSEDRCTISIDFNKSGYYQPMIALNNEPALVYKVYVTENQ